MPTFSKTFLFGVEFDFLILECLVIACMDRASFVPGNGIQSGFVLGVLIAYIIDYMFIYMRSYKGNRNIALHTLIDD
ncbi:MAG: hypothetical protein RLZZ196_3459 [Bacteroidota bacterium]|jgi:hypothetical protein